jgi:hypothetical protein
MDRLSSTYTFYKLLQTFGIITNIEDFIPIAEIIYSNAQSTDSTLEKEIIEDYAKFLTYQKSKM